MLNEQTLDKLKHLGLHGMAKAWEAQQGDASAGALTFDERLGLLVDTEYFVRENKRLVRLLREAKLKIGQACIENIDYSPKREIDKSAIRQLATCRWVQEHQTIVVSGMTGVGKTYVGCALAQQACRNGYRALYRRASRFFQELALARADGTYGKLLARLARIDVLLIDDWALSPARESDRHDLLEVIEDRYGQRSTIITSQLPPSKWHDYLGDPTVADAILDRLLHNAHKIVLKGPSRRKEPTTKEETSAAA
jgi:DNA replication protein DnaC